MTLGPAAGSERGIRNPGLGRQAPHDLVGDLLGRSSVRHDGQCRDLLVERAALEFPIRNHVGHPQGHASGALPIRHNQRMVGNVPRNNLREASGQRFACA